MIKILVILLIFNKFIPEALNNALIFWVVNSIMFLITTIYIYKKEDKTVINMVLSSLLIATYLIETILFTIMLFNSDYRCPETWKYGTIISLSIAFYLLIARKRYDWELLKSDFYNSSKVQAIYSRPKTVLTLLGATISLSPKCSVRYSHNGLMIRFKKGHKKPILVKTVIKETDIIKDTNFNPSDFSKRWDIVKKKNYNIFTFNCRHLMK